MKSSLRAINYIINDNLDHFGKSRLYIQDREREYFSEVRMLETEPEEESSDILYLTDWKYLKKNLNQTLPQNILCFNAKEDIVTKELEGKNILFLPTAVTEGEIKDLAEAVGSDYGEMMFPKNLLELLHEGSLDKICELTSKVCCNPVFILDFNFYASSISLFNSDSPEIAKLCSVNESSRDLLHYTHLQRTINRINAGELLKLPGNNIRFYLVPVMQENVSVSSILLIEDRVRISPHDLEILRNTAKGMEILEFGNMVLKDSGKPIYEYALVRALSDEYGVHGSGISTRFHNMGFSLKENLRLIVLDSLADKEEYDANARAVMLSRQLRMVIGSKGLVTTVRDYIVILLNLDNKESMERILLDLRLFSSKNHLIVGISPWFSDIEEVRLHHRKALDTISIGPLIMSDDAIFFYDDIKVYKLITAAFKDVPVSDLIPEGLDKLIRYDQAHNSEMVNTLYYYIYCLGNANTASQMLNIHRNTFTYRMEKIRNIMESDLTEGTIFLELGIAFYVLELIARQDGRKLCFAPIHRNGELEANRKRYFTEMTTDEK